MSVYRTIGPTLVFYFTANASFLLILFKYASVETTCHLLTLFSEIGVFRVFDRDFPFGIGSSVRYFTIFGAIGTSNQNPDL